METWRWLKVKSNNPHLTGAGKTYLKPPPSINSWWNQWVSSLVVGLFCPTQNNSLSWVYLGVSKNRGTPKSSLLIRFSIINHPFWGTRIFGNIHLVILVNFSHGAKKKIHSSKSSRVAQPKPWVKAPSICPDQLPGPGFLEDGDPFSGCGCSWDHPPNL